MPKMSTHHLSHDINNLFSHITKEKNCKQTLCPLSMCLYVWQRQTYPHVSALWCLQVVAWRDGAEEYCTDKYTHLYMPAHFPTASPMYIMLHTHTCTHTYTQALSSFVVLYQFSVQCRICFWLSRLCAHEGVRWLIKCMSGGEGGTIIVSVQFVYLKDGIFFWS